jgi:predicted double-glycine peptidase
MIRWVLALALAVGLSEPASPRAADALFPESGNGPLTARVVSLAERRFARTVRQAYDFSCGSAAVATLLTYHYGLPTAEDGVFREMFTDGDQARIRRQGFSLLDMQRYLRARDFQADGFAVPLSKLAEVGIPAIVLIRENGFNHFVVVKGMRAERVLVGDPSSGTRVVSREQFEALWQSRILFVVRNHLEAARFNDARDWAAAPLSPLSAAAAVDWNGSGPGWIPKFGPGGF